MTKKVVCYISSVYTAYFSFIFALSVTCSSSWCRVSDEGFFGRLFFIFLPLLPVFLLSLITQKMSEEVFRSWWNFGRWFVSVIIILTALIEIFPMSGGGWAGLYKELPYQFLGLLYFIFIAVSLTKIFLSYRRNK